MHGPFCMLVSHAKYIFILFFIRVGAEAFPRGLVLRRPGHEMNFSCRALGGGAGLFRFFGFAPPRAT